MFFGVFLLEVPTGIVADYFGRKMSIILACLAAISGVITYSISPNFYIFLTGEFLLALATALLSGADQAIVYDSLKIIKQETNSKKILGKFFSVHLAAIAIAAPIGSLIATYLGLKYAMLLTAIPILIAFFIALTLTEPPVVKKESESTRYLKILINGIKYLYQHRIIKIFLLDNIPIAALSFMLIWLYQPTLLQLKLPILYLGFVHAALSLVQVWILNNFSLLEK